MDCSPPGSSVHDILQARILDWVAISFSRGSSSPRGQTHISCIVGRFFIAEPSRKPVMPTASNSQALLTTHSSTLAWKIPWTEEPGRLQSMGSLSQTWLSDFTFTFHFHALEKEMATHSSVLAWRIPGTTKPGGLPSMGSHRVGHDWNDLAAAAAVLHTRCGITHLIVPIIFSSCCCDYSYFFLLRKLKFREAKRFAKVTQLVSVRAGIGTQVMDSRDICCLIEFSEDSNIPDTQYQRNVSYYFLLFRLILLLLSYFY